MTKTILYIEDDSSNRLLVRHVLQAAGYRVIEAVDGLNGVQAAQAERAVFQNELVGLDLKRSDRRRI